MRSRCSPQASVAESPGTAVTPGGGTNVPRSRVHRMIKKVRVTATRTPMSPPRLRPIHLRHGTRLVTPDKGGCCQRLANPLQASSWRLHNFTFRWAPPAASARAELGTVRLVGCIGGLGSSWRDRARLPCQVEEPPCESQDPHQGTSKQQTLLPPYGKSLQREQEEKVTEGRHYHGERTHPGPISILGQPRE